MTARNAFLLVWLIAILSPGYLLAGPFEDTESTDPTRFLEVQLMGENPAVIKAFEAIPEGSPLAKQILLDSIETFKNQYGTLPKLAFVGSEHEMHLISDEVLETLRAEHTDVDDPLVFDLRDWFKSNAVIPYDIQAEIEQRSGHHHPTRQTTGERKPVFSEYLWGGINGFTIAIMGGWLWYIKTDNYEAALNLGILLTIERIAHYTLRPMIDHFKRLPDGLLARKIKHLAPWMLTTSVWKILLDVSIGMLMIQIPRAIPWVFQVYEGDAWVFNFSDASMTTFVLWNLFIQSILHSIADPFSLAKIYNEGWGTISRKVTNWISYIKPYFTNSLTLLRIPSAAAGAMVLVSTANVVTGALIGVGVLACVLPWSNVFQFFAGGEVVIGPDLRPKYIKRKHSFGIRYLVEAPDPRVAPGRYVKIDTFFGYRPVFENGNQALKFDNTYFVLDFTNIRVTHMQEGEEVEIADRDQIRKVMDALVHSEGGKTYRFKDGKIELRTEGEKYSIDLAFKQVALDSDVSLTRQRIEKTHPLTLEDEKLLDALVALGDLRIKQVSEVVIQNEDMKPALLLEVEGMKIYHRFGYHFIKDQGGDFAKLPVEAMNYVDYMAAINESMGRYLKRIVSDGTRWQLIKRHSLLMTNVLKKNLTKFVKAPFQFMGFFRRSSCKTP